MSQNPTKVEVLAVMILFVILALACIFAPDNSNLYGN
jgi:hypothetical protein